MQIYEQLRDLEAPLRLTDMPAYVRALGIPAEPVFIHSFQGAPMRHQGVQVGNFFLGEKEGGREVHRRGRGGVGAVCLAGGDGDRQRPQAPVPSNGHAPTSRP